LSRATRYKDITEPVREHQWTLRIVAQYDEFPERLTRADFQATARPTEHRPNDTSFADDAVKSERAQVADIGDQ